MKSLGLIVILATISGVLFGQSRASLTNLTGHTPMVLSGVPLTARLHRDTTLTLKDSVDLSPFAPQVAKQPYKNCYSYASVYVGRTLLYNFANNITWQPDSTIFSTGFLQKIIYKDTCACQASGYDTYAACQLLRDSGVVFRRDFKKECGGDTITPSLMAKAKLYRVNAVEIYQHCDLATNKIDAIKESLSRNRPVVIGWYIVSSFKKLGKNVWKPTNRELKINVDTIVANHAICIVGFNNKQGAFQVMNSWGPGWGKKGKMWVTFEDLAHFSPFGVELSNP